MKSQALLYGDASTYVVYLVLRGIYVDGGYRWNHFTNEELKNNHDDLLRAEVGLPEVSFVFQYISH